MKSVRNSESNLAPEQFWDEYFGNGPRNMQMVSNIPGGHRWVAFETSRFSKLKG